MKLNNSDLFRTQCLINGKWVNSADGRSFEVTDPASGDVIGTVPDLTERDVETAIEAAGRAFADWSRKTAKERGAVLRRWFELILENGDDIATIMTTEQGKPISEAKGEVAYAASFVEWYAEEAKRGYGEIIPTHQAGNRLFVLKQPIGVTAAITPWNFPAAMLTRKGAPALAAGCPIVAKPAEDTPYTALALGVLAQDAGFPDGLLNIVTGDAERIGKQLCASETVRKLSFTGSTEVGKILMRQSADTVKKISLELGGNAAFIVFDDADIDAAVEGAVASKYRNTGQTCVCANRFFIQSGIYDAFAEKFAERVRGLNVGPGMRDDSDQGPLINRAGFEKVQRHIADAVEKGGRVLIGGAPHDLGGTYFQPTVIADATSEMEFFREETFGPVAPLIRFETEAEVLSLANDVRHGLANYFYSRDIGRVWRVAESLESGIVGVNTGIISTEVAPFGGVKESGLGREGSHHGMDEFLEIKYVNIGL